MNLNVNNTFWKIIKDINWPSDFSISNAKKRMNSSLRKHNLTKKEFEDSFRNLRGLINEETSARVDAGKMVFEPGVNHGADDCHFIDMPAHLIGLGQTEVNKYLKGEIIKWEPVECLSYIFH